MMYDTILFTTRFRLICHELPGKTVELHNGGKIPKLFLIRSDRNLNAINRFDKLPRLRQMKNNPLRLLAVRRIKLDFDTFFDA
ncbi:MAG: hypothetical protein AAB403_01660, partial [Planctomycetota bacterium]